MTDLALIAAAIALRDAAESLVLARKCLIAAELAGTDWLIEWATIAADLAHELDPATNRSAK
jgi:hypothetical protein